MSTNEQQTEQWNGVESNHWVENAERYDRQLAPFAGALFDGLMLVGTERVLDVGCDDDHRGSEGTACGGP